MNQFNYLNGEEPNESPIEWNSYPPAAHFKSRTSHPKTIPVVSAVTGILNNHAIDNLMLRFTINSFQFNITMNMF